MIIGFTGTRNGMTDAQINRVAQILEDEEPTKTIDGMCVGSDAGFALLSSGLGVYTIGYPGHSKLDEDDMTYRDPNPRDEERESKTHFERNRDIVNECDIMIATPSGDNFDHRGGTNYTIKYALKVGKEINIILPNGDVLNEID